VLPKNKVVYKILLDENEALNLRGNLKNIHLFSSDLCKKEAQMNQRGNKGVTKYFKIPLSLRSRKKPSGILSYQNLSIPSKIFYIYTITKGLSMNGKQKNDKEDEEQKDSSS